MASRETAGHSQVDSQRLKSLLSLGQGPPPHLRARDSLGLFQILCCGFEGILSTELKVSSWPHLPVRSEQTPSAGCTVSSPLLQEIPCQLEITLEGQREIGCVRCCSRQWFQSCRLRCLVKKCPDPSNIQKELSERASTDMAGADGSQGDGHVVFKVTGVLQT